MSFLECHGVDVAYDKVQVLFGVEMEVEEGEIVALLGTNGAGKSTLLKAISGLVKPSAGSIMFDGRDITRPMRCKPPSSASSRCPAVRPFSQP
jgi:branched-chain amino acid transport system ATP-binding protein